MPWSVRGLLGCGVAGWPVFTVAHRVIGARRNGYEPRRDAVSTLSEGPAGWLQGVNFAVWGGFTAAYAAGLRCVLDPRTVAGRWVPRATGLAACGLGVLSVGGAPSAHRGLHIAATTVCFAGWSTAVLLLVPHHAHHPGWRGWATCSVAGAPAVWALGAASGLTVGKVPSGLLERLALAAMGLWGALFAARLLLGTPPPTPAGPARRRPWGSSDLRRLRDSVPGVSR